MKKRSIKTKLLIQLRQLGMICRKPRPHKYELKLKSTYIPPNYSTSINSERFVFIQNKLSTTKGCEFDPELEICECGAGLDEFLTKCPKLNDRT